MINNAWRYFTREACRVGPWKYGYKDYKQLSAEQEAMQDNENRNHKRYNDASQAHLLHRQERASVAPPHIRWLRNLLLGSHYPTPL